MIWKVRLFWSIYLVAKDPNNTKAALAIGEALYHTGSLKGAHQKISSQSDSTDVIKRRQLLAPLNIQNLQNLPQGTLGRVYAEHMVLNNLNPDFYKKFEITNDSLFVMMRLRQTHDLWHALTGFTTSVPDELGLQAFLYAQTHAPLPPLLIAAALLKSAFKKPWQVGPILDRISIGWKMGIEAKPIFALDWEAHWTTPIEDVRNLYGVKALKNPATTAGFSHLAQFPADQFPQVQL
jgi:ubiquinone biosynthesis protein COQ4